MVTGEELEGVRRDVADRLVDLAVRLDRRWGRGDGGPTREGYESFALGVSELGYAWLWAEAGDPDMARSFADRGERRARNAIDGPGLDQVKAWQAEADRLEAEAADLRRKVVRAGGC